MPFESGDRHQCVGIEGVRRDVERAFPDRTERRSGDEALMAEVRFPARAFVQIFQQGRFPPENELVVAELKARGVPIIAQTTEEFAHSHANVTRRDLVVGDFDWTRAALKQLGVPFPEAVDYPDCLKHLLRRKIWQSTLGQVQELLLKGGPEVFIKPAVHTKAFSGLVASKEWLTYLIEQFPPSMPVMCSELVTILAEYRVYVVNGGIRKACHYKGRTEPELINFSVVEDAVKALTANVKLAGCAIDFAVIQNGDKVEMSLMEVNDGFSLGAYSGLSGRDYTDLLIARWAQLMAT